MFHTHAVFVAPRADSEKGDTVPVFCIHVRLYFEHKSGEFFLIWFNDAILRLPALRRRGKTCKTIEHFFDTKVPQRGAKIDGRLNR